MQSLPPTPAALAELWSHVLPELADVHSGRAAPLPVTDAAFQQAMAVLTEQIQGAVAKS